MSYSTYLIRLPSSYYFRICVPACLQSVVGKTEIRYSLKCASLLEAKPKARLLAGKIQQLFSYEGIMELSQLQIDTIISDYIHESLDCGEEFRAGRIKPLTDSDIDSQLERINDIIIERKEELTYCNYHRINEKADEILEKAGLEIDRESDSYGSCRLFQLTLLEPI